MLLVNWIFRRVLGVCLFVSWWDSAAVLTSSTSRSSDHNLLQSDDYVPTSIRSGGFAESTESTMGTKVVVAIGTTVALVFLYEFSCDYSPTDVRYVWYVPMHTPFSYGIIPILRYLACVRSPTAPTNRTKTTSSLWPSLTHEPRPHATPSSSSSSLSFGSVSFRLRQCDDGTSRGDLKKP